MSTVATVAWADFETAIAVDSTGPYFQAVGLDRAGREIGRSEVIKA
jgi:hypothetical protein